MNTTSPHNASQSHNMVLGQLFTNKISNPVILEILAHVAREDFVPPAFRGAAYMDEDLEIVSGRFMLAPLTFAQLLQLAEITPSCRALVVGDNGYATTIISKLAGHVVTVESDAALLAQTKTHAAKLHDVDVQLVALLADGYAKSQPYDVIFINGAVKEIPDALASQLAIGGRLVAVRHIADRPGIGGGLGKGIVLRRLDGQVNTREHFDASAPLLPGFKHTGQFDF